ncbi:hypothetical protein FOG50_01937 [Hanseniaspora uvarum]|nr:hypothetical protein FOG50_01937 [Hanseniaspora uvarum]
MGENKSLIKKDSSNTNNGYESLPLSYSPNDTNLILSNTHKNLKNTDNSASNNDNNGENDGNNECESSKTPLLQSLQDSYLFKTSKKKSSFLYQNIQKIWTYFPEDDTTNKNILAWFIYLISSEPFIVSIISTYMPIILETFATLNAVKVKDHSKPCIDDFSLVFQDKNDKCVLPIAGMWYVDPSSFALYVFSTSVFFQTILVISISGLVDNFNNTIAFKKKVMFFFGILGAASTILISLLYNSEFYSLAVLCIVSNCCYGVVNVLGNSLLPVILNSAIDTNHQEQGKKINELTTVISGKGTSLGYLSALLVQIICIGLIKKTSVAKPTMTNNLKSLKIAIFFVGLYWIITQIPILFLLNDVKKPDEEEIEQQKMTLNIMKTNVVKSWKTLGQTIIHASSLKQVSIFLVGWFVISDSITTINSTAILFSKNELHMNTINLVFVSVSSLIFAIIGAFFIPSFLIHKFSLPLNKLMLVIIIWACFIPLYGILGFVFENIGLKHKFEMYFLAVWYGLSMGALNAVSRSIFALIIPSGRESIFFSIFNITDKGSSIVGPVLTGLIIDKTHQIRYSFILLLLFLVLALPIFNSLNVEEGKEEAQKEALFLEQVI